MTPLEINKKIAEIKGLNCEHAPNFDRVKMAYLHIVGTPDSEYDPAYYFNWAENISDAWELFEDLPKSRYIMNHTNNKFSVGFFEDGGDVVVSDEPTAQLAICKAWIKFKEGQNK